MQVLKQRFSRWYNLRMGRKGALYEERFKSVLVEGPGTALTTIAAYIDLNPVRARIVQSPQETTWTGYSLANAGDLLAIRGIQHITRSLIAGKVLPPTEALACYLKFLGSCDSSQDASASPCQTPPNPARACSEVLRSLKDGGPLTPAEYLRLRIRPFHDGAILGTRAFVDDIFKANRSRFGPRRKSGARRPSP